MNYQRVHSKDLDLTGISGEDSNNDNEHLLIKKKQNELPSELELLGVTKSIINNKQHDYKKSENNITITSTASGPIEIIDLTHFDDNNNNNITTVSYSFGEGTLTISIIRQGFSNKCYRVPAGWTIKLLKQHIFPIETNQNQTVILIYMGKVLSDNNTLIDSGILDNTCIHAHISHNTDNSTETNSGDSKINDNELILIDMDTASSTEQSHPIDQHEIYNSYIANEQLAQESYAIELREGTARDLFVGFFIGALLGILAMYFLWQTHTSRKFKLGVVLGISLHSIWSLWGTGTGEQRRELGHRQEKDDPDPLNPALPGVPSP